MVQVRTGQLARASSKVREDGKHLHIAGEPGIGKTKFLHRLKDDLSDDHIVKAYTVPSYKGPTELHNEVLYMIREAAPMIDTKKNEIISGSISLPFFGGGGASVDDRASDLRKIEDLTSDWSGTPLVLCIDDIHKVHDDQQAVHDIILELVSTLGDDVYFITAGRLSGVSQATDNYDIEEFILKLYTREQTRRFLESAFADVSDEIVKQVHNSVDGHPLHLSLLTESSDDVSDLHLPEDKVMDSIEVRYFNALPQEERQFLRKVAPLPEFDENTCAGILDKYSAVEVADLLQQLNKRTILQRVNRTDEGNNIYKIHSVCREHLRAKHQNEEAIYRAAFQYHIKKLGEVLVSDKEDKLEIALPHSTYVNYYLQELYNYDPEPADFREELDQVDLELPVRFFIVVYTGLGVFRRSVQNSGGKSWMCFGSGCMKLLKWSSRQS